MSSLPRKFIYDTDPGVDDSMAFFLAMASPELELVGVTTVFGNGGTRVTTENALRLVERVERTDIPVVRGAERPLLHPYSGHGAMVHGADGLGNSQMPAPQGSPTAGRAASFIVDTVLAAPGEVTLIAVGPLTNLALAVSLEPDIVPAVREVIIMGGAANRGGNASPVAEANIHNDSAAANIVFHAGWPLTMVGLDVTTATIMSPAYLEELGQTGNVATDFIARIVPFYLQFHQKQGVDGIFVHDSSAITYALDPSVFRSEQAYVDVCVSRDGLNGQTTPDWREQWQKPPNVNVCLGVDDARLKDLYRERVRAAWG